MLDYLGGHDCIEASAAFGMQKLRRVFVNSGMIEMNRWIGCTRNRNSSLIRVHTNGIEPSSAQLRAQLPVTTTEI